MYVLCRKHDATMMRASDSFYVHMFPSCFAEIPGSSEHFVSQTSISPDAQTLYDCLDLQFCFVPIALYQSPSP